MKPFSAHLKLRGFTLIEIIIVVTIIAIFFLPLLIGYGSSRNNEALRASAEEFANNTKSAHIFAREARDKKEWGLKRLDENSYAMFTKSGANEVISQSYELAQGITFKTNFNLVFKIGTGETEVNHTIILTNKNGTEASVEVLKTGVVELKQL